MPTLVLKPFTELVISKQQEQAVLDFMQSDDELMTLNKITFHRSTFAYIKPGGTTQADLPAPSSAPRLKADNRSEGEQFKAARRASEVARKNLQKRGILRKV